MSGKLKQIAELLNHVYGPYPDYILLKPDFLTGFAVIRQFRMVFNNKPIGFDETEFISNPPANSRIRGAQNSIICFGVLEIEKLEWLTENGYQYLEQDLNDFDARVHLEHMRLSKAGLSLRSLYGHRKGEGSHLKVMISFKKHMLAAFMTAKGHPEKFLVYSQYGPSNKRTFHIASYHCSTYRLSLNFETRYRLRALIVHLIQTDPNKTPLEGRTIDWLIDRYIKQILPSCANDRIIRNLQLGGDIMSEKRHPRFISRTEIRSYFATHADWLLANQLAHNSRSENVCLLNIPAWISFCKQTRFDVYAAAEQGKRWGMVYGSKGVAKGKDLDKTGTLASRLAKFGSNAAFWEERLRQVCKKASKSTKDLNQVSENPIQVTATAEDQTFAYDSDFSEQTTDCSSNSEPESGVPPISIPVQCLRTPEIPSGRFDWNCGLCSYKIDLLNLSPHELNLLPPATIQVFHGKSWNIRDEPIVRAFYELVSSHWKDHLLPQGIHVVDGRVLLGDQAVAHLPKKKKKVQVKVEAVEEAVELRRSSRVPRPHSRYQYPEQF